MKNDETQIARISGYEAIMTEAEMLLATGQISEKLIGLMNQLSDYYASDEWKQDFADDEAGRLPEDLKRGVLSEDGIYNLLEAFRELQTEINVETDALDVKHLVKDAFVVIGKEGSTADGEGFIFRLWQEANTHFEEIAHLAKRDENGNLVGIWGAMSDFTHSFMPWDHFQHGLYLAGAECRDDAEAPDGWVKWVVPASEFLYVENKKPETFNEMMQYMHDRDIPLAGAVNDFTCPATQKNYIFCPIRRL